MWKTVGHSNWPRIWNMTILDAIYLMLSYYVVALNSSKLDSNSKVNKFITHPIFFMIWSQAKSVPGNEKSTLSYPVTSSKGSKCQMYLYLNFASLNLIGNSLDTFTADIMKQLENDVDAIR